MGAYAGLGSGTEQMAPDKRDKLAIQERNALQARDTYARSLYTLQQAEENQVLNPRNKAAQQDLSNATTSAQSALQQYAVAAWRLHEPPVKLWVGLDTMCQEFHTATRCCRAPLLRET